MEKIQTKLICRSRGYTTTFEITKTHLIKKWKKGRQSGEKRIELSKLSPDLSYITGRSDSVVAQLIGCCICIAIAAILFFSIIQDKVPLLSLAFCILAFFLIVKAIRGMRIRKWTTIHRETGEEFAWYTHDDSKENERKAFEESFTEIITKNNQQKDSCNQLSAPLQADT